MSHTPRMPVLFVGHGSPMNAITRNTWTDKWRDLGRAIPRPEAILCISAHFMTQGLQVVSSVAPKTIHDFYGFPQTLYAVQYPAPGSVSLSDDVCRLLPNMVVKTEDWGIDHGAWSVLVHLYPQADVPVVQLSIDMRLPAREQLSIGQALRPLRDQGVLILGSGNIVHNLRTVNPSIDGAFPWAKDFGDAIHALTMAGDLSDLAEYQALPGLAQSVPTTDHFVPFLNVAGAVTPEDKVAAFNHEYAWGSLSMTGYLWTE